MSEASQTDCFICRKHCGEEPAPGGPIYENEFVWASHGYHTDRNPEPYLGHVVVEPKAPRARLSGVDNEEAAAVGVAIARVSRATSAGAEPARAGRVGRLLRSPPPARRATAPRVRFATVARVATREA